MRLLRFFPFLLVPVSCSLGGDGASPSVSELTVISVAELTRGYVAGASFEDMPREGLHDMSAAASFRSFRMSSYLRPQDGEPGNYFTDLLFERDADDKYWHHTPRIYWPVGGELTFLAYSSSVPFADGDVEWDENDASSRLTLDVHDTFGDNPWLQDDIVFAWARQRSANGASAVPMSFQHAQAWLEFRFRVADASMAGRLAVTSVVVEDVYTCGLLTVASDSGGVGASWSFRHETAADLTVEDCGVYGSQQGPPQYDLLGALDAESRCLDVLLPEQPKTGIVVSYIMAGQPNRLTFRFRLPQEGRWLMGCRYVYDVCFSVSEVTVTPVVTEHAAGGVSDLTPVTGS